MFVEGECTWLQEVKDEEIDDLFKAVDHDGNDAISFEEFCVLATISDSESPSSPGWCSKCV